MRLSINKLIKRIAFILLACFVVMACSDKKNAKVIDNSEDKKAKQLLQGIWMNNDDGDIAFRVLGDSIFYPDSLSVPVAFKIQRDSFVLLGSNVTKYPIIKQSEHVFEFKNSNDEVVRLVKSDDPSNIYEFEHRSDIQLNQHKLIKTDTIVTVGQDKYHSYAQINPTSYKVVKTEYNDDGVEVDNVYYDNIIHISVFKGYQKMFSKDFYKYDFGKYIPKQFLRQSILNDIVLYKADNEGLHYKVTLSIPDSPLSYILEMVITQNKISRVSLIEN